MSKFNLNEYLNLIHKIGFQRTWDFILNQLEQLGIKKFEQNYFNFEDFGKYYEIGLAETNKISKKNLGKYYTPKDVAFLMSDYLLKNHNFVSIADTGCGCGNLIISFLIHAKTKDIKLFNKVIKHIYVYDIDPIALKICSARIKAMFKNAKVFSKCCNFLDSNIHLPTKCAVIANPPYSIVKKVPEKHKYLKCFIESKELYAAFYEKIISSANAAVLLTPQSFLVGKKFTLLRQKIYLSSSGSIFSFDNVPGTLFEGKKAGIFNSNTGNSVRASISVLKKSTQKSGIKLTHLIRFKKTERQTVLTKKYLDKQLGGIKQNLIQPLKCFKELEPFVYEIVNNRALLTISTLLSTIETKYKICVSTSARYFTLGAKIKLERNGYYIIYARDINSFYLLYALINSSYCYLFWRMLDGGILYPKSILLNTPLPTIKVSSNLKKFVNFMIKNEQKYKKYKVNAGKKQESIKFPESYRKKLNELLFKDVNFDLIHRNNELGQ